MPLQTSEKTALEQATLNVDLAVQAVASLVAALVADPVPNPLQEALNAMTAERDAALATVATLQGRIDASKAQLQAANTADAAEDAARNAALQSLG